MGRDGRHAIRLGAAAIGAIAVVTLMAPQPGVAEELFGSIFRFLGAAPPRDDRYPPIAYADPGGRPPDQVSPSPLAILPAPALNSAGGGTTFCVRLCDGRYYPLSAPAAALPAMADKMCARQCPASRTAIYRGDSIDAATANGGERYAALANAYVYREKIVAGCTCNGRDAFGLAPIDVANDPTLRPGDAVATTGGVTVFRGPVGERHRTADFTPVGHLGRSSVNLRQKLATIRVAPSP